MSKKSLGTVKTGSKCNIEQKPLIILYFLTIIAIAAIDFFMFIKTKGYTSELFFTFLRYFIFIIIFFLLTYHLSKASVSLTKSISNSKNLIIDELDKNMKFDYLTGISNKHTLKRSIESLIWSNTDFTLFSIDLDDFTLINDIKGQIWSDNALKEVALYLEKIEDVYLSARLHEDTFSIIIKGILDQRKISLITKRILNEIRRILHDETDSYLFSASIGIGFNKTDAIYKTDVLRQSEIALSKAKSLGKNKILIYDDKYFDEKVKEILLMSAIKPSLSNNDFYLEYQPVINIQENKLTGVEVLTRWKHPELGFIPPDVFIKLAEATDDIHKLTEFVVRESFKQLSIWMKQDIQTMLLINLSPKNLMDFTLPDMIMKYIRMYEINPKDIVLEITESSKLDQIDEAIEIMHKLKELGFLIAIDDFGTGYSTLTYIKEFPIDVVKIDKSFIKQIETSKEDMIFLDFILEISRALDKRVILEGVETEIQESIALANGVKYAQGYFYAKPKSAEMLIEDFKKYGLIS